MDSAEYNKSNENGLSKREMKYVSAVRRGGFRSHDYSR